MSKINLIYGVGDTLNTHININPFVAEEADNIVRGDIVNLDQYADDSEVTELLALDVINYIPLSKCGEALENWVKKIRIGGTIVVGGIDLLEVCKDFSQYRIDITETNILLHGRQDKPYLHRKNNLTITTLCEYLSSSGLTINKKRINDYKMIVEAVRK